jgi:hypothetical protein
VVYLTRFAHNVVEQNDGKRTFRSFYISNSDVEHVTFINCHLIERNGFVQYTASHHLYAKPQNLP